MVALPMPAMYGGNPLQSISQSGANAPKLVPASLYLYMYISGRYDGGFYLVQP
jgi:hypothetical protein